MPVTGSGASGSRNSRSSSDVPSSQSRLVSDRLPRSVGLGIGVYSLQQYGLRL